jgi:hypothetical protein
MLRDDFGSLPRETRFSCIISDRSDEQSMTFTAEIEFLKGRNPGRKLVKP